MSVTEKGVECFGLKDMVRPPRALLLCAAGCARFSLAALCLRPPPSHRLLASSVSLGKSPADRQQEETSCPYPAGPTWRGGATRTQQPTMVIDIRGKQRKWFRPAAAADSVSEAG